MNRKTYLIVFAALLLHVITACKQQKTGTEQPLGDTTEVADPDTTIYGRCGDATTMHVLQLVTDEGSTMSFLVDADDSGTQTVKGGMLAGDRFAVTARVVDGDTVAVKAINLNTLQGKWMSIDRNFEIVDGGEVISAIHTETNPYTFWKIHNGSLLLGADTFDIITLGSDSLELENNRGIFVYKRQTAQ